MAFVLSGESLFLPRCFRVHLAVCLLLGCGPPSVSASATQSSDISNGTNTTNGSNTSTRTSDRITPSNTTNSSNKPSFFSPPPEESGQAPVPCPNTWSCSGDLAFKFFEAPKPRSEAKNSCEKLGPGIFLATISNKEQERFVYRLTRAKQAWIGLSDQSKEGEWLWDEQKALGDGADLFWGNRKLWGTNRKLWEEQKNAGDGLFSWRNFMRGEPNDCCGPWEHEEDCVVLNYFAAMKRGSFWNDLHCGAGRGGIGYLCSGHRLERGKTYQTSEPTALSCVAKSVLEYTTLFPKIQIRRRVLLSVWIGEGTLSSTYPPPHPAYLPPSRTCQTPFSFLSPPAAPTLLSIPSPPPTSLPPTPHFPLPSPHTTFTEKQSS